MKLKKYITLLIICFLCSSGMVYGATETGLPTTTTEKKKSWFWQKKQENNTPTNIVQTFEKPILPNISPNIQTEHLTKSPSIEEKLDILSEYYNNNISSQNTNTQISDKNATEQNILTSTKNISIDSDTFEFFPEKHEAVATGNVVIKIENTDSTLYADKIVHNTDLNTLKGYGNVRMVKGSQTITGEFIHVNLNEENILVYKPLTEGTFYKLNAKEGYVYSGEVIAKDGTLNLSGIGSKFLLTQGLGGQYFVPKTPQSNFYEKEEKDLKRKTTVIKAKTIYIKSLKDHDEVDVKNASYYFKDKKIFTVPNISLTTNKSQDFIETSLPEFGSFKNYASYLGLGHVFNIVGGSTLKIAPVIQFGRSNVDNDYGVGVLARFHSKNNLTEGMVGTVDDMMVGRGQHILTDTLKLQYAHNAYMDEWFMGMRMPEYLLQLTDDRTKYIDDLGLNFRNKFSAGYVSDYYNNHLGTMRFRWQTEMAKTLWSKWNKDETVGINAGLITQTSASMYGTGDFQGVVRGGPFVGTKLKNWEQTLVYFQGGQAGQSPMLFDQYMYGKANLTIRETLQLNKYASVGYLGSLALLKDNWENKLFQENQFFVAVGPEDFKVSLLYDPIRERLRLNYMLILQDRNLEVPFDEMIIKDAETLGRKSNHKKTKKKKNEL